MKFLHTADLHIGKKIFELSMLEDQKYILEQIYEIACRECVDAVLIAGDIYDRALPPAEAVSLLDDFLTKLAVAKIPVLMISGNHDSPERVSFAEAILEKQGLHIAGTYRQPLKEVVLSDEQGDVHFVLMPFVKPAVTGHTTNREAVEQMLGTFPMTLSLNQRYVLMTHYFVLGDKGECPEFTDAETDVNVGGLDGVPTSLFANFDYVALGHIHKPQKIGEGNVYYAGAPLKYSFGEALSDKSVMIVELGEPGEVTVHREMLRPLHELRCIRGKLAELLSSEVVQLQEGTADFGISREDYLQITLTDSEELIDPIGTLRSVYPNVLQLLFAKNEMAADAEYEYRTQIANKSTEVLFGEFYEMLKGEPLEETRLQIVTEVAREAEAKME